MRMRETTDLDRLIVRGIPSPVGLLRATSTGEGVRSLSFPAGAASHPEPDGAGEVSGNGDSVLDLLVEELNAYFRGRLRAFSVPLDPKGTAFQRRVWDALLEIPFGATRSYREVATTIGHPSAVRALGGANGRNPIAIIIPCHRVIGADGSMIGYGGGVPRKRWLLAHERGEAVDGLWARGV